MEIVRVIDSHGESYGIIGFTKQQLDDLYGALSYCAFNTAYEVSMTYEGIFGERLDLLDVFYQRVDVDSVEPRAGGIDFIAGIYKKGEA